VTHVDINGDNPALPAGAARRPGLPDVRLDAVLGSLPQEKAPASFAAAVLTRLERRRVVQRQWQTLAAAALLLLAVGLGDLQWQRHREQREALERLARLRAEYSVMQAELDELQEAADRARPMIYLGGSEGSQDGVDLVLDLSRLAVEGVLKASPGSAAPAPAADNFL
jgi:hypothetical protein